MSVKQHFRYPKGKIFSYTTNIVDTKNARMLMWWAATFPGFGHIALCKFVTGSLLIIWEFVININAGINTAIIYTFTGQFELAEKAINTRWFLLYIPVYVFSIWDVRRLAFGISKYGVLADMTGSTSKVQSIDISALENNFLEIRKPTLAILWTLFIPGLGHLYTYRTPTAFYIIIWWVAAVYYSDALPALQLTMTGHFSEATSAVQPEWFLFMPSIYGFALYDSYISCVDYNKLFRSQQSLYLQEAHQNPAFQSKTNLLSQRGDRMNVVATFAQSLYVELVIKELEQNGILEDDIFAVPITERGQALSNTRMIKKDGIALFDGTFVGGSACMTLGAIYGFVWTGGPILWGIIGLLAGGLLGFVIDYLLQAKQRADEKKKGKAGEVVLVIHCDKNQVQMVKEILFAHFAFGLSVVETKKVV